LGQAARDSETIRRLAEKAGDIRRHVVRMVAAAKSGHPGGSLSAADIVTVLYFHELRLDPSRPDWPGRDRFVLSKGHAAPVLYAALAERGFFPVPELASLRKTGGMLQGHPDMKRVPGVDMSTGSLGQGLSAANGMALAGRLDKLDYRVYVLLGDGEIQEGQIWEAAMAAAHYKLDNLVAILDHNRLQIDGRIDDVMSPEPVADKWRAFGWHVLEIDGHDYGRILEALAAAREVKGKPTMVVADTIKGKGVSFMENQVQWHGVAPTAEELAQAIAELGGDHGQDSTA
jgi:transketolase